MDDLKLPTVSFIVTSFNYGNFITKTLDSIVNQTYENTEIIVVDDHSSDNSVEIIEEYIQNHTGIKFYKHSENKGQLAAIQTGLSQATGQFISFIDSDDILNKDYAKTFVRVHLASGAAFASAQTIEINENDEILTTYSVSSFQKVSKFEVKSFDCLLNIDVENVDFDVISTGNHHFGGWWWSAMSSAMFRRASLEMILKYDTPQHWTVCADKFLFNFAHLIGGSALVYAPLAGKRRHGSNAGFSMEISGNKRYNNDVITKLNIENNKKIRRDVLNFIKKYRKDFNLLYGKNNVNKLIRTIYLSYFYIIKQLFKFAF